MKTLTENWSDHSRTGTRKHTETWSKYFDGHGHLSQSEESKFLWTHDKDGVTSHLCRVFTNICSLLIERDKAIKIFQLSFRVSVLLWSLQFLVRVFTFLSLILYYSYFGTFLSTCSKYVMIFTRIIAYRAAFVKHENENVIFTGRL